MPANDQERPRVVIVGGGFAGLAAARGLRGKPVDVTLVDKANHHLFQPLLYQVATGGLSPAQISAPLRAILKHQANARVVMQEVVDLDVEKRRVLLADGDLPYDALVLAAGVRHHYFGHPEWEETAPGLKTIEDATNIRARILRAFEDAERTKEAAKRGELLTFVVVGGGPTGVELAGAIGELANHTLRGNFRSIDPAQARVLLVEGADRILTSFPENLAAAAVRSLERLGVEVRTNTLVEDVGDKSEGNHRLLLRSGEATEVLAAGTVLWAAGVQASPLASMLEKRTRTTLDPAGRVKVQADCTVPGHSEILVLGDMAYLESEDGRPLPGVAPVAMQQGRYAAKLLADRLARGKGSPVKPFRYRDRGSLAVIGRAAAVADLGRMRFSGFAAWFLWLFIHIMYLVGFTNRLLVLFQWAYSYLTWGRGARLITGRR